MTITEQGSRWRKTIGIVGGLGPHAHVAFEQHLLDACNVTSEQEYPPWVLVSHPGIPDRTTCILADGASPVPGLNDALEKLKAAGADFAVIACNTSHHFVPQLSPAIPILDIVAETLRDIRDRFGIGVQIGLLATTGTLRSGLYQDAAIRLGLRKPLTLLELESGEDLQRELVMDSIYGQGNRRGIKQGELGDPNRADLRRAASLLVSLGAEIIVMGCTEIPLVFRQDTAQVPLVNPLVVAARLAVSIATGNRVIDRKPIGGLS